MTPDNFEKTLSDNSHLFEGNKEICKELFWAISGNIVTNNIENFIYPLTQAFHLVTDLYLETIEGDELQEFYAKL